MDFPPKHSERRHGVPPEPCSSPDVGANGSSEPLTQRNHNSLDTATKYPVIGGKEPKPSGAGASEELPLWMRRVFLVVRVAIFIELGMILVVLPWSPFWLENNLLLGYPSIHWFLRQNFVRGLISGIGLVDVWLGIWEAARYKESGSNDQE
jgi:hypothetical protein